jgi:Domain of unknown function (DUF2382)
MSFTAAARNSTSSGGTPTSRLRRCPHPLSSPTDPRPFSRIGAGAPESAQSAQRLRPSGIAPAGPAFEERVIGLSLMEEELVVSKRIVPSERARLRTEIVTTDKSIKVTLRQEIALERTPVLTDVSATGTVAKNADA